MPGNLLWRAHSRLSSAMLWQLAEKLSRFLHGHGMMRAELDWVHLLSRLASWPRTCLDTSAVLNGFIAAASNLTVLEDCCY